MRSPADGARGSANAGHGSGRRALRRGTRRRGPRTQGVRPWDGGPCRPRTPIRCSRVAPEAPEEVVPAGTRRGPLLGRVAPHASATPIPYPPEGGAVLSKAKEERSRSLPDRPHARHTTARPAGGGWEREYVPSSQPSYCVGSPIPWIVGEGALHGHGACSMEAPRAWDRAPMLELAQKMQSQLSHMQRHGARRKVGGVLKAWLCRYFGNPVLGGCPPPLDPPPPKSDWAKFSCRHSANQKVSLAPIRLDQKFTSAPLKTEHRRGAGGGGGAPLDPPPRPQKEPCTALPHPP